ncbi:MAG: DMT family transporter [Clostridiales bacterium]|nr:DMT family transporter [Clostridiales bacterium]
MLIGVLCVVLASVAFGFTPVFATEIVGAGMDTMNMLVFTNASSLLLSGAALLLQKNRPRITKRQFWQLMLFGGCYGLTILLLSYSYRMLPIGIATFLHFCYPIVVTAVMVIIFKEHLSLLKIAAIAVSLLGLFLILDISGGLSLTGALLALASGFVYAAYVIAGRKSSFSMLPVMTVVFFTSLASFMGFLTYQLVTGGLLSPPNVKSWLLIISNAAADNIFAIFMMTCAIRRMGASNAAIGNLLEPVTSLLAGALLYRDKISPLSLVGCALVLLSILLIALYERKAAGLTL